MSYFLRPRSLAVLSLPKAKLRSFPTFRKMASTTPAISTSSFGQTLQFITDIKLQELEKQRLAYQVHAKIIDEAKTHGDKGDILKKVEVLAKAVKSWTGSGGLTDLKIVGGSLQLANLEFWLQQAKKDPSFSREIAQGWADTLEDHIRHTVARFDSAKLFGNLFNEWLASGDSVALSYQSNPDDPEAILNSGSSDTTSAEFVEVGRKEMHEQKEKLISIVFDDYPVDAEKLKAYLEALFESVEGAKALKKLRKEVKDFSYWLQRRPIDRDDVKSAIAGLLADNLMSEEKRTTLKAFLENPTVLDEVASVLKMRMASLESWAWPKEGISVDFRRHLNGKYRAFTDPEIIDALFLHHVGVAWQVKFKHALRRVFDSKAWIRPTPPTHKVKEQRTEQLRGDSGASSIEAQRNGTRREDFFLTQLQENAYTPSDYDNNAVDTPTGSPATGSAIKQKLLHLMTTECYLNTALHGSHAAVCSDLEWFGPSLPHTSILTILEFMGMSKTWLNFYKAFLFAPLRFAGETGDPRVRKRGTPISYSLSVLCGESVIFFMDFAVNQRAAGLYLYRMHDDLWLWDADAKKVADGWSEMKKYAELVGLTFNEKKTGSAFVGPPDNEHVARLPPGEIRWGFLKFDAEESRFVLDQAQIDEHVVEMRRQLDSTNSVFGWVNAYNKYMAFFMRNFGGIPANCFGQAHVVSVIDTLARIQQGLFPTSASESEDGGAVGYLRKTLKERFGVVDLPEGYFYRPIGSGGLELRNTMLELFALERRDKPLATYNPDDSQNVVPEEDEEPEDEDEYNEDEAVVEDEADDFEEDKAMAEHKFLKRIENDRKVYTRMKDVWDQDEDNRRARKGHLFGIVSDEFMSFEEFTSLRETWLKSWGESYQNMLQPPPVRSVVLVPKVRQVVESSAKTWMVMDWYEKWVVSMYGEEVVKKFGGLDAVDPNLIPVGMVQLFRTSRMKLDQ